MNAADLALLLGDLMAAPSPSDGRELNSVTVSPGLPGFFATFVLAAAVVLLVVDMSRRTRRVQARARVEERRRSEEQARQDGRSPDGVEGETRDGTDQTAVSDPAAPDEDLGTDADGPTSDDQR